MPIGAMGTAGRQVFRLVELRDELGATRLAAPRIVSAYQIATLLPARFFQWLLAQA